MPIILSNRLQALYDAMDNFGSSIAGIRASQKKSAQDTLNEQRAAAQEQRSQEAHTVTMGRQKTAAGLEDIQFSQAKAQDVAGAEARSMASELEGFGQAVPDQEIALPGFAAQASGPSAVVTDAGEGLKDRLRASMHNAGLRAEGKNTGFVSAEDVKKNRVQTAADLEMKKKKDAADLAGTEASTKAKLMDAKKTDAEIKKLDAELANLAKGGVDPEKAATIEGNLRTQFLGLTKPFQEVRDSYNRLKNIKDSPAGDVGLIFAFMKINDPGASVQEGDKANVSNTAGVPERIRTMYNNALTGASLDPKVRADLRAQALSMFNSQKSIYDSTKSAIENLATRYQVDPTRSTIDLSGGVSVGGPEGPKQFKTAREAMASGLPAGTRVMINGEEAEL